MSNQPPNVVRINASEEPEASEYERVKQLRHVLGHLTPRSGPSQQICKTADYDGVPEHIADAILNHTEEGLVASEALVLIMKKYDSGNLA